MSRLAALAAEDEDIDARDEEAVVEAQRRMTQAEEAFSRFDYAAATTQLGEALELLRPSATRATGRQRLAEAHLALALVLSVHGEREAALEELRTCRHVDPDCAPDPARHPPELVELAREAGTRGSNDAALEVRTDPEGATVTLDGGEPRVAPHTFEGLDAGRHYLALERDGFVPEVHVVSVAAGRPTTRVFPLHPGSDPARASAAMRALEAEGTDADVRWRAEAAGLSEADVLLVLRPEGDGIRLGAFDVRGASLGEPSVGGEDAARDFLDRVLPPPTVPIYGQWWFWTPIVAVISIGLATGTFLLVNTPSVRIVGGAVTPAGGLP